MSGIGILLGLLVLSFVGSMLVSGRTIRGFGLPSGAEYLVLGVVIGPHALGLVTRSSIAGFDPIFVVGAGWLAFVSGLGYGVVGRRRLHPGRALAGVVAAVAVGAGVAAAVFHATGMLAIGDPGQRLASALGAGVVSSETTRHTVRWVVERHGARGPVSDWVADMARASAAVPILGLLGLLAMDPATPLGSLPIQGRVGIGLGLGVVLGGVAAVLLSREFRRDESWGILLGTTLLGAGLATRFGLSAMATLFTMGLSLSLFSRHRHEIKAMVQPSEKPVLLPVVLVAGAYVDLHAIPELGYVVAVAVAARFFSELARGAVIGAFLPAARPAWAEVGLAMSSSGALTLAAACRFSVHSPGAASATVLVIAAAGVLFGELVGPAMLRRAMERTGEAHAVDPEEPAPLSLSHPPSSAISEYPGPRP